MCPPWWPPIHLLPSPSLRVFPERWLWVACFMHRTWKCRSTSSCPSWFQLRNLLLFSFLSQWHFLSDTVRYSWRTGWVYILNSACVCRCHPDKSGVLPRTASFLVGCSGSLVPPFAPLKTSHQSGIPAGGVLLPPRRGSALLPPELWDLVGGCGAWCTRAVAGWGRWRHWPSRGWKRSASPGPLKLQKWLGFYSVGLE